MFCQTQGWQKSLLLPLYVHQIPVSPFKRLRFQKSTILASHSPRAQKKKTGIHPKPTTLQSRGRLIREVVVEAARSSLFSNLRLWHRLLPPWFQCHQMTPKQHEAFLAAGWLDTNPITIRWGLQHSWWDGRSHIMKDKLPTKISPPREWKIRKLLTGSCEWASWWI